VESFFCETPTPELENLGLPTLLCDLREIPNSSNQTCTVVYKRSSARLTVGYRQRVDVHGVEVFLVRRTLTPHP